MYTGGYVRICMVILLFKEENQTIIYVSLN